QNFGFVGRENRWQLTARTLMVFFNRARKEHSSEKGAGKRPQPPWRLRVPPQIFTARNEIVIYNVDVLHAALDGCLLSRRRDGLCAVADIRERQKIFAADVQEESRQLHADSRRKAGTARTVDHTRTQHQ